MSTQSRKRSTFEEDEEEFGAEEYGAAEFEFGDEDEFAGADVDSGAEDNNEEPPGKHGPTEIVLRRHCVWLLKLAFFPLTQTTTTPPIFPNAVSLKSPKHGLSKRLTSTVD